MKIIKKIIVAAIAASPFVVFAATTVQAIIAQLNNILNLVIPVLMILATVVFLWGIIMYILATGSDDRKKEAKNLIIWGLIALFVMVAVWGLVAVIGRTIQVTPGTGIPSEPGDIGW